MYVNYAVWVGGSVGQKMVFPVGRQPQREGAIFGEGIGECNVMYRSMWHCGVDVAYPQMSD